VLLLFSALAQFLFVAFKLRARRIDHLELFIYGEFFACYLKWLGAIHIATAFGDEPCFPNLRYLHAVALQGVERAELGSMFLGRTLIDVTLRLPLDLPEMTLQSHFISIERPCLNLTKLVVMSRAQVGYSPGPSRFDPELAKVTNIKNRLPFGQFHPGTIAPTSP